MRPRLRTALLLTISAIPTAGYSQQAPVFSDSLVRDLAASLRRARLVFSGRVVQIGARTTASLRAGPNNVIVTVDSGATAVLKQPRGMRDLRGRRVTIVVRDTADLHPGDSHLWFTYGLASDSGLALAEVSRVADDQIAVNFQANAVDRAAELNAALLLNFAWGRSSRVLLGNVDTTLAIVLADSIARLVAGEHQFHWRRAVVSPLRGFKPDGNIPGTPIGVLYPIGSRPRLPPLLPGTRALFFLRPASLLPARNRVGIDTTGMSFVADSIDVLSPGDTLRLRRIIKP